jgi:primosomal protein N' (replication factor Y)
MNNNFILRVAVPTRLSRFFDYLPAVDCNPQTLQPGIRVLVPFQNRQLVGILLEVIVNPPVSPYKLKQVTTILDDSPIVSPEVLRLCLWAADYYHYSAGKILEGALPVLLRQGKPAVMAEASYWQLSAEGLALDLEIIKRAKRQVALIQWLKQYPDGVTQKSLREQGIAADVLKMADQKGWIIKIKRASLALGAVKNSVGLQLNAEQEQAVLAIQASQGFQVFLLDGVTGSGKTEVYLQVIRDVIAKQKQVLVLVPEIGLTPQTIERFRERFSVPVIALHSKLGNKERLNGWLAVKSENAAILIGTRSAIFLPLANLGLIVIDEEHDLSFKQQDGFRYHARDLAVMRAHFQEIPIILGSATPSLETLHNAMQGRYQHLILPKRAGVALTPQFRVLDIRNLFLEEGLSPALLQEMTEHLNRGDQVMLFLNRRGYAPVYMCHTCGGVAKCKRCDARLTFHHEPKRLHCHHCDARRPIFSTCEECGTNGLQVIGLGTERLEIALQKHFPAISIARIDRDSTQRKGQMENLLEGIQCGAHQILIGTQMLAKGHHFPNVTLVGIIDADGGFFSSDFRALERMGQLLVQVSGRAGRVAKPGTVLIQTHHPEHPLLHQLLQESYQHFALSLLREREQAFLPPYGYMALFRAEAHHESQATQFLQEVKNLALALGENIPLLGPVPAPMAKRAGRYRVQLLLQAKLRPVLHRHLKRLLIAIDKLPSKQLVRWSLDVDPLEMY